jgi:hypothetical protein
LPSACSPRLAQVSAQVADVYISLDNNNTTYQVYGYAVSSTGKLTAIKGSPFTTPGNMVGSNGSHFITIGTEYVYSSAVAANGAIGEQVSEINTQNYTGATCGTQTAGGRTNPVAGLDQTGQNVYVPLSSVDAPACNATQTFKVGKTGTLTFLGATIYAQGGPSPTTAGYATLPSLLGNNKFAFNQLSVTGNCAGGIRAFARESTGTLNNISFTETDPTPQPNEYEGYLSTSLITADAANHLAIVVNPTTISDPTTKCFGRASEEQLASYTVNSQGDLTSTNTYKNMPVIANGAYDVKIDPTGNFVAVALATGVQVYHFNGAKPITPFTGVIATTNYIFQLGWDDHGHLYAQDGVSGEMHVYNVTSSKVEETKGSPTLVEIGQAFTVHSK